MRLSRHGEILCVQAPAKLNLSLDVLGRRPDGYHQLQTVMLSVRLYDSLHFSQRGTAAVELRCDTAAVRNPVGSSAKPQLSGDDSNLVYRAAALLKAFTGCDRGVRIDLIKRIPMEAGLGGGSSDAAAALVGLNEFWGLKLSSSDLHHLAAQLGSDVNFFIDSPVAALCTGRGEEIQQVEVARPFHFAVLKPDFGLSTGQVFQAWGASGSPAASHSAKVIAALRNSRSDLLGAALSNDLALPASRINTQLQEILARIADDNVLGSGMTGSGSGCYALCRTAAHARHLARKWKHWKSGQVFVASSGV